MSIRQRATTMFSSGTLVLALAIALLCTSAPAAAAQNSVARYPLTAPLSWRPEWHRFRPLEYAATAGLGVATIVGFSAVGQNETGPAVPVLFDDAVRDALAIDSRSTRDSIVAKGNVLYLTSLAYPIIIDAGLFAGIVHGSAEVMAQMMLIDVQALALSGAIGIYTQKVIGRRRPFVEHCSADPNYDKDCGDPVARNQSFLSGHTVIAFTGAGLVCVHHAYLPLFGGGVGDTLACGVGLTAASAVGLSRLVSDRHYATDVLYAAAVGLGSGWLMPWLLHYRGSAAQDSGKEAHASWVPLVEPRSGGVELGVMGIY